jgi:hypothetical protein
VLYLLLFALVFFLKRNSNEKIRELSESVKEDLVRMKDEMKKSADALSLKMHENSANLAAKLELSEEKQQSTILEIKEAVDKMAKELAVQKTKVDEQIKEFISKTNTEKSEHKSLHDKIESEVKGLRTLHVKDVEEIKSKL